MPNHAFLQMPLHLLSLVLSQLDSMPSLASAIFSHSSFYAALDEDRDRIIRTIVRNQIPREIRCYALPAYLAASGGLGHGREEINDFLSHHIVYVFESPWVNSSEDLGPLDQPGPVNVDVASTLSRTHAMIEHFARDFIHDTLPLANDEIGLGRDDKTVVSSDETFRIHRAMYRYLLYCNLFRSHTALGRGLESPITLYFFQKFAPWVNEQLACVHDYFERVLSRGKS